MINKYLKKGLYFVFIVLFIFVLVGCDEDKPIEPPVIPSTPELDANYEDKEITKTKVVMYDGPAIIGSSSKASVKVNDKDLFLYETKVNHGRVFTYSPANIDTVPVGIFDFEGEVTITISITDATLNKVKVTPLSYKIDPEIKDNKIIFKLTYPGNYTVEWNDQTDSVIHLFANEIEKDPIDPNNIPNDVIYIGPGVYKADTIAIKTGETLYLAGGAIVYGKIAVGNVSDITIRGRGIISGEIYSRTKDSEFTIPFDVQKSNNVTIKDVVFLDSAGWTLNCYFLTGLTIDNVRIITGRANGDGISLQSCKDVVVKNSFVRSWDDSIVVKNYDMGISENILVEKCTIWTDLAQSMEVGYECYGETINDVTFKNITVLHNFHKAVMSVHNSDQAKITNITFENITIEDAQMMGDYLTETNDNYLIDLRILYSTSWTSSGGNRGTIDNVTIKNVLVLKGIDDMNILIQGYDDTHKINNVKIEDVTYINKAINDESSLNTYKNDYISDISYSYKESTGARLYLPYKLKLSTLDVDYEVKENVTQKGFLVPDFSIAELTSTYMGMLVTGDFKAISSHGISASKYDDGQGSLDNTTYPSSNLVDGNKDTYFEAKPWDTTTSGDYVAVTIDFGETKRLGTIRLWFDPNSSSYFVQNIAIYGVKEGKTTFSKLSSATDLEFTPASGNYVDVKINPGAFTAIQIRIYHKTGTFYTDVARLYEVEFYPASLTYGRTISGTEHEDVYKITNIVDGNPTTYYEGKKGYFPANIIIDMGDLYNIKYITFQLPPQMGWTARTEVVNLYVSTDGNTYTKIKDNYAIDFDPMTGNIKELILDNSILCQYFKIEVLSSNSGYGAQFSEISIFD